MAKVNKCARVGYECTAFLIPPRVKARIDLQKNANGDHINRPRMVRKLDMVDFGGAEAPIDNERYTCSAHSIHSASSSLRSLVG